MYGLVESIDMDAETAQVVSLTVHFPDRKRSETVRVSKILHRGFKSQVYSAECALVPGGSMALKVVEDYSERVAETVRVMGAVCSSGCANIPVLHFTAVKPVNRDRALLFVGMELLYPVTLRYFLNNTPHMEERDRICMANHVCSAVNAVHGKKCVHRDIQPNSFLFDRHGYLKLVSFGLAVTAREAAREDVLGGACDYVSPEMAQNILVRTRALRGKKFLTVDERSDVWSVGMVLFSIFTRSTMYSATKKEEEGETGSPAAATEANKRRVRDTLMNIYEGKVRWPAGLQLPDVFRETVEAILQRDPEQRPTMPDVLRLPIMHLKGSINTPACVSEMLKLDMDFQLFTVDANDFSQAVMDCTTLLDDDDAVDGQETSGAKKKKKETDKAKGTDGGEDSESEEEEEAPQPRQSLEISRYPSVDNPQAQFIRQLRSHERHPHPPSHPRPPRTASKDAAGGLVPSLLELNAGPNHAVASSSSSSSSPSTQKAPRAAGNAAANASASTSDSAANNSRSADTEKQESKTGKQSAPRAPSPSSSSPNPSAAAIASKQGTSNTNSSSGPTARPKRSRQSVESEEAQAAPSSPPGKQPRTETSVAVRNGVSDGRPAVHVHLLDERFRAPAEGPYSDGFDCDNCGKWVRVGKQLTKTHWSLDAFHCRCGYDLCTQCHDHIHTLQRREITARAVGSKGLPCSVCGGRIRVARAGEDVHSFFYSCKDRKFHACGRCFNTHEHYMELRRSTSDRASFAGGYRCDGCHKTVDVGDNYYKNRYRLTVFHCWCGLDLCAECMAAEGESPNQLATAVVAAANARTQPPPVFSLRKQGEEDAAVDGGGDGGEDDGEEEAEEEEEERQRQPPASKTTKKKKPAKKPPPPPPPAPQPSADPPLPRTRPGQRMSVAAMKQTRLEPDPGDDRGAYDDEEEEQEQQRPAARGAPRLRRVTALEAEAQSALPASLQAGDREQQLLRLGASKTEAAALSADRWVQELYFRPMPANGDDYGSAERDGGDDLTVMVFGMRPAERGFFFNAHRRELCVLYTGKYESLCYVRSPSDAAPRQLPLHPDDPGEESADDADLRELMETLLDEDTPDAFARHRLRSKTRPRYSPAASGALLLVSKMRVDRTVGGLRVAMRLSTGDTQYMDTDGNEIRCLAGSTTHYLLRAAGSAWEKVDASNRSAVGPALKLIQKL